MTLRLVPVTLRQARAFVAAHHRHHKPPAGWRFGVGITDGDGVLVGVAMAGRPVARHLDDGVTVEVNRTCTDGTRNANSALYGAIWRAARSLGYVRAYTYTLAVETGASLKAAGWTVDAELPARGTWHHHSRTRREGRDPHVHAGVDRLRWHIGAPRTGRGAERVAGEHPATPSRPRRA